MYEFPPPWVDGLLALAFGAGIGAFARTFIGWLRSERAVRADITAAGNLLRRLKELGDRLALSPGSLAETLREVRSLHESAVAIEARLAVHVDGVMPDRTGMAAASFHTLGLMRQRLGQALDAASTAEPVSDKAGVLGAAVAWVAADALPCV